jgi:hypothetical protein
VLGALPLLTLPIKEQSDRSLVRLIVEADLVTSEAPMMKVIVPAAAVLLAVLAPAVRAEPPAAARGKQLAALEQKLVGAWKGRGGCAGDFVCRADGTYERTAFGPAASDTAGTWEVRWDALPPTLVLTCAASEVPEEVCKVTELKLLRLDPEHLAVEYTDFVADYTRVKK